MKPGLLSFELAWVEATFDAIFPEESALPHGIKSMNPAPAFSQILGDVPLEQALGMRAAVWMIALAPLFTIFRFGTIASVSPADRARVLERLVSSRVYAVRMLVFAVKAMASLLYLRSPAIRARMTTPLGTARSALIPLRTPRRASSAGRGS